jgi:predicted dehydrogenase
LELLRNFAENEGVQPSWICDVDDKRLAAMGRRYPAAQTATDYGKLLSDPGLDAVAVATPVATHFQIAKAAVNAGKHVLVEKPLTATIFRSWIT